MRAHRQLSTARALPALRRLARPLLLAPLALLLTLPLSRSASADEAAWRTTPPTPLAPRPFQLPEAARGQLSNGVEVWVVENHEVPITFVALNLKTGSWADPADRPGLASMTLGMLTEGAAGQDNAAFARRMKAIGGEAWSGAGLDTSQLGVSALQRNLPAALDALADMVLRPDFPAEAWAVQQKSSVQNVKAARQDPGAIAGRVMAVQLYGPQYAGRLSQEAAFEAMSPADLKAFWASQARPDEAVILVGGDTTLAEVLPLLEARLGAWKGAGAAPSRPAPQAAALPKHPKTTIFLADRPGATQSTVRVSRFVGERLAADATALELANEALGGAFTSRVNMNLREAKGWTYGARSSIGYTQLPGTWSAGGNFVRDHTADAISELLRELREARGPRPLTADELANAKGGLLGGWPLPFQQPGHLLGELASTWRYSLPADHLRAWPERMRAVTPEAANAAVQQNLVDEGLVIVVVGDATVIRPSLDKLGLPIVPVDTDGAPLAAAAPGR